MCTKYVCRSREVTGQRYLGKAEPISNFGSTCVTTHLRRIKTECAMATVRKEREYVREAAMQIPRVEKNEVVEVVQAPAQRFPCSLR